MIQKKNILFIIESLGSGGAERALIEILNNFDFSKYSVTLCLVYNKGALKKEIPEEIELIHIYPPDKKKPKDRLIRKTEKLFRSYSIIFPLRIMMNRKLKHRKFDVIISYLEGISLVLHDLIRKKATLNITWVHSDMESYHWTLDYINNATYESLCYSHMDKIVFVSQGVKESFEGLYDVNVDKLCLHNIIDSQRIKSLANQLNVLNSVFTITTIGTLKEIKGFDRLIRVAARLKEEGFIFHIQIIGEGKDGDTLKNLRNELSLEKEISFLGHQSNPLPYLQASDLFISASTSEAYSLAICEAMVLGVPVIATKTAGGIELLGDSIYGLITQHDDNAIYESIKKMMSDNQLRNYYKKQALLKAAEFNVETRMSQIYRLIENCPF